MTEQLTQKPIDSFFAGENLFLPVKTIFAGAVFSMEKKRFFSMKKKRFYHLAAKTCQPCIILFGTGQHVHWHVHSILRSTKVNPW